MPHRLGADVAAAEASTSASLSTCESGEEMLPIDLRPDEFYSYDDSDEDDRETFSSGRTVASAATDYVYENGRRYHFGINGYKGYLTPFSVRGDGQYYQPNDETVSNAEVIQHHLWLLTLDDKLYTAPLQDLQHVLDVGTGTGLWAIDFADLHPSAEVIGTDLSPIQIPNAPPNVVFEIDDCTDEWTYPAGSFDYIHARGLTGCVKDWVSFYGEALKTLKPGGYIEHLEYGTKVFSATSRSTDPAHQSFDVFLDNVVEVGKALDQRFDIASDMASSMQKAGFVDIVDRVYVWPIGQWPKDPRLKDIGRWNIRNWEDSMESWCLALFTRNLGWTYDEVQEHIGHVKAAVRNRRLRNYQEVRVVYAKKSEEGSDEPA